MITEETPEPVVTLLVVDDHEIVRLGLKASFRSLPRYSIVAEAVNGVAAVEKSLEYRPDVVLMDIRMPQLNGIEATKAIKSKGCQSKILILTSNDQPDDIFASLSAGADGYCMKDLPIESLCLAIDSVYKGACWLDSQIARLVLDSSSPRPEKATEPKADSPKASTLLTARELNVLQMVVEGRSNLEIGEVLNVSLDTVKSHMTHILNKLAVSDRTQAAVKALREGIVS